MGTYTSTDSTRSHTSQGLTCGRLARLGLRIKAIFFREPDRTVYRLRIRAYRWLDEHDYVDIRAASLRGQGASADVYGIKAGHDGVSEVLIRIEHEGNAVYARPKDCAEAMRTWKMRMPQSRSIVVVVPEGLSEAGEDYLDLYDTVLD